MEDVTPKGGKLPPKQVDKTGGSDPYEIMDMEDIAETYEAYNGNFRKMQKNNVFYCKFGFIKSDENVSIFILDDQYCGETILASEKWTKFYLRDLNVKYKIEDPNIKMMVMVVDRENKKVYRAKIIGLPTDNESNKFLVFCVDEGVLGIFTSDQFYYPTLEFLLPPWRTVACHLASGLDFFITEPEFDHAFEKVKSSWKDKPLLIRCLGIGMLKNTINYQVVSVYDAEAGLDSLSLTQQVLDACLTEDFLRLKLPSERGTYAIGYISHADVNGNIYIRGKTSILDHLEQVLGQWTFQELVKQIPCTTLEEVIKPGNEEEIYLAEYFGSEIYRAVLKGPEVKNNMVEVKYIDYGNTRWVYPKQMVLAAYVSDSIPLLPPLTSLVRLEGVERFVGNMTVINSLLDKKTWIFVNEGPYGELYAYSDETPPVLLNSYLQERKMAIGKSD